MIVLEETDRQAMTREARLAVTLHEKSTRVAVNVQLDHSHSSERQVGHSHRFVLVCQKSLRSERAVDLVDLADQPIASKAVSGHLSCPKPQRLPTRLVPDQRVNRGGEIGR